MIPNIYHFSQPFKPFNIQKFSSYQHDAAQICSRIAQRFMNVGYVLFYKKGFFLKKISSNWTLQAIRLSKNLVKHGKSSI